MGQVAQNQGLTILMKFGKEKNLKSLQSGLMYMKNLAYYVGQEKKDSDDVIGDQYDGVMLMQDMQINIKDIATKNVLVSINAPKATMDFGYMKYPVFCMFRYDERNKLSETTIPNFIFLHISFIIVVFCYRIWGFTPILPPFSRFTPFSHYQLPQKDARRSALNHQKHGRICPSSS